MDDIKNIEKCIEKEMNKKIGISLNLNGKTVLLTIKKKEKSFKLRILEHSRNNYYNYGVFNKKRNCYYPADKNNIAEFNKLEKLFKKFGLKTL